MNYRMILRLLCSVLRIVAVFMIPAAVISLCYGEMPSFWGFAITIALMLLLSLYICARLPDHLRGLGMGLPDLCIVGCSVLLLGLLKKSGYFFIRLADLVIHMTFSCLQLFQSILSACKAIPDLFIPFVHKRDQWFVEQIVQKDIENKKTDYSPYNGVNINLQL